MKTKRQRDKETKKPTDIQTERQSDKKTFVFNVL